MKCLVSLLKRHSLNQAVGWLLMFHMNQQMVFNILSSILTHELFPSVTCWTPGFIFFDFIFLGSKIIADSDCSHEIKRHLLLGRKVMTKLDSELKSRDKKKSRDITLPTKVHLVKAMVFPVVMCACESWTVKKAEHRRIDAFELWCWRRLFRVTWTARRSYQSILQEINPE